MFGLAWTLLLLAPSLYGIGYFANLGLVHDRYAYQALVGLAISAAVLGAPVLHRKPAAVAGALIVAALCVLTFQQQAYWRDDDVLFSRAVYVASASPAPLRLLANLRLRQGRSAEATSLANTCVALDPNDFAALIVRAAVATKTGDAAQAERSLAAAAAIRPDRPEPHALLAQVRFQQSRDDEGIAELNRAVELFPNKLDYRLDLATAYIRDQQLPSAVAQYKAALLIAPQETGLRDAIAMLERQQMAKQKKQ